MARQSSPISANTSPLLQLASNQRLTNSATGKSVAALWDKKVTNTGGFYTGGLIYAICSCDIPKRDVELRGR